MDFARPVTPNVDLEHFASGSVRDVRSLDANGQTFHVVDFEVWINSDCLLRKTLLSTLTMFTSSTQHKHWMFESSNELDTLRFKSNTSAGGAIIKRNQIGHDQLLSPKEELSLVRSYLVNLREFCRKFQPSMRKSVIATAFIYMKRFYLNESCMEYHPRNIGVTCAYLACKVDEFNVSIDQFIKNVKGDCRKAQKTVLSNELLLMKKLHFHLTVHLPFRAVEGFLIDLRARYPPVADKTGLMADEIEDFLEKSMYTDATFLYTPSQIALAAVCHAAEKCDLDLENYLNEILFADDPAALEHFRMISDDMRKLIEKDLQNSPGKDLIKKIEKKLQEIMTT